MKLLLDEMYSAALAGLLGEAGIDAVTVADLHLTGAPDLEVFTAAGVAGRLVVTENVGDFTRVVADHVASGRHHFGVLIALSSRFSRRPGGLKPLAAAIGAVAQEKLDDRVVYLQLAPDQAATTPPGAGDPEAGSSVQT